MSAEYRVILKPGREKSLLKKHPWIFSGAIFSKPSFTEGEIIPVHSYDGNFLATAYFHSTNSIAGRILSFQNETPDTILPRKIAQALDLRRQLFDPAVTNAYRLINAEGDGLPGLIVDCYADVLVMQVHTCGMEKLKPQVLSYLIDFLQPKCICEKSVSSARRQEGLPDKEGHLWGEITQDVEIVENGLKFQVALQQCQKTGLFLDQREMRQLVRSHSAGKKVLNGFSYTGGFSLFALQGGASHVDSVDMCQKACEDAERNTVLNDFDGNRHQVIRADVFDFLARAPLDYDLVILDPPAFAKKRGDVNAACLGYKSINRQVFEKAPAKTLLLTCSCSYFIDESLFQNIIFQAAAEAGRSVKILGRHRQALDHPVSLYHPEGAYLKSLFLYIH